MDKQTILVIAVLVLLAQSFGYIGSPAATPSGQNGGTITVQTSPEDVTVTLGGVNAYVISTRLTSEYGRVFKDGFDYGLVSLNSGSYTESPAKTDKIYFFENSSTYYTEKQEKVIPSTGTADYQAKGIAWDTSLTLTFYNDDDQPNTAQAQDASTTKTVGIKYAASSQKGFGNPQCALKNVAPATVCFEYNSTSDSAPAMKLEGVAVKQAVSIPASLQGLNASWSMACFEGKGVYNSGFQKYSVDITSNSDPTSGAGSNIGVYYEDCDFDFNADNLDEIWSTHDEDNNNLGASYQHDTITRS